MSIFTTKLRTLVSQDRLRHEEGSVNIDLTYVTDRVLAMSFPASGFEAAWRNDIQDVCRLLRMKHKNNFLVFNLSERDYEYDLLDNQIVCFPFKDHHAPPLHIIFQIIFNIDSWLKANPQHVAIVHCIGGKGRTGLIIVCYLFFCGMYSEVDKCLEHFARARSAKGKGVTQPSQLRYARYFCGIVSNKLELSLNPLILTRVSVGPVPKGFYVFVEFYPQLADTDDIQDNLLFSTFAPPEARAVGEDTRYTTDCHMQLSGDILVRGYIVGLKETKGKNARMFRMQFHTGLVHRGEIAIPKGQLDDLNKEKKKFADFELRLMFDSSDHPRNSVALYNMIFNQMKTAFNEKKIAEDPDYLTRQNTLKTSNDSPNNSSSNFATITNESNEANNITNNNTSNISHNTSNNNPPSNSSNTNNNNTTNLNSPSNNTSNTSTNNTSTTNTTSNTNNTSNTNYLSPKNKANKQIKYNTLKETKADTGKGAKGLVGTYRVPSKEDEQKIEQLLDSLQSQLSEMTNKRESRVFHRVDPPRPQTSPASPIPSATNPPPYAYSFIPAVPTTPTSSYAAATSILTSNPLSPPLTCPLSPPLSPPPHMPSSTSPSSPSFSTLVSLLSRTTSYNTNSRAGVTLASPREFGLQREEITHGSPPRATQAHAQAQDAWKDSTPSCWENENVPRNVWRASSPYPPRRGTVSGAGASPNASETHNADATRTASPSPTLNGLLRPSMRAASLDSVIGLDPSTSSVGSLGESTQEHQHQDASRRRA